jgi:hypothetical protein
MARLASGNEMINSLGRGKYVDDVDVETENRTVVRGEDLQ